MGIENFNNFFNKIWTQLDINKDGSINNQDKVAMEAQNSDNLSIYTKFANALGNVNVSKNDYEEACENAYNVDDVINNLKLKNSLNGKKQNFGLVPADLTTTQDDNMEILSEYNDEDGSYNVINIWRNEQGRIIRKKDNNGTLLYEYDENGETINTKQLDNRNRIIYESDKDGNETFIEYEGNYENSRFNIIKKNTEGKTIYEKDEDGIESFTEYNDDDSSTITYKFPNGKNVIIKNDSNNRRIYQLNDGVETTTIYNDDGSSDTRVKNPDGTERTEKRDTQSRTVYELLEDGTETTTSYGDDSKDTTTKFSDGSFIRLKTDNNGREIYGREIDGTETTTSYNQEGKTVYKNYSNGKTSTSKYNNEDKLEERTQVLNNYEIHSYKQNGDFFINVKNTNTGEEQLYTFDNVEVFDAEKEHWFELLSKASGEVIQEMIDENPKIYVREINDNRSYMSRDESGEMLVIDPDDDRDSLIPHEMGHIIDHTYNGIYDVGFSSDNEEFTNAFNIGINRYEADGHVRHEEIWDEEQQKRVKIKGDENAYCTYNQHEMFAECYTYLTIGKTASTDIEIIKKYFPECLELVKQHLDNIRAGRSGDRNLKKFTPSSELYE